jgi:flagellar hook-associated protein 2
MASISSTGIGSGLDVKSIVSQLVALEKQPLTGLKAQAATTQTKISAYGQIQSLISTLSDAASNLASVTGWNAVSATSSDTTSVSASAIGGASPTQFSVEVSALAKAKSTISAVVAPPGSTVGAGTLSLTLGGGSSVSLTVSASDTVASVASAINGAGAGVTATVLTDATGDHLLLRSSATGVAAGFTLAVTSDSDGNTGDATGLSRLVVGSNVTQAGVDAAATINGIPVTSATNTFANSVSGVTFTALKVTTGPVDIAISKDNTQVSSNVDAFVKAYNAINDLLADATKYDSTTKSAGLLQGDSSALSLQNNLRAALQSVTTGSKVFSRLADVGLTQQRGGDLVVDPTKLTAAMGNITELKNLFSSTGGGTADGIAVKIKSLATSLLSSDGFFTNKTYSLQKSLDSNSKEQDRVNTSASTLEASLTKRYSALDAQMASLNALNAYISQQVIAWNKNGG